MRTDRTGLVLIEEAVQLLRTAPVTVFALYCGGTVPFLLALFSFCTEMSYSRDAGAKCTTSAVLVALAYCWMKGMEVFCCRELVRAYTGNIDRWWEPKTMLSIWSRQIAFQPLGLFIRPLAWLLLFPVTYVSAFFQNLTVLGGARRNDIRKSWELARLWPAQNHTVYGLLSLLALIVFLDLYVVTFSTPFILKSLLGIEGFLTRSYTWIFSPVLIIGLAAVAHFIIDLLAKAIHVIRCCDGESQATGADLLRRLNGLRNPEGAFRAPTLLIVVGGALLATPVAVAGNAPPNEPITQPALNQQIERVLENPEFNWRESYSPAQGSNHKSLIDQLISWTRETFLSFGNALKRLWESLLRVFDFKNFFAQPPTSDSQLPSGIFNALTYLLWAAFAGILILFAIRLRKLRATVRPKQVGPPAMPDLNDEQIAANQLPEDEWSALARQKISAGEFRLALRALFLAILALLASHRFILVERWKSNSDYETELRRRAKNRSDLLALFAQSRLGFERCWYGADSIASEELETYHGIYERIKHAATHNL